MEPTTTPTTPPSTTSSSPSTPKLRLMCSYGGHIVPRPTDKTLCYAGGQTRIVAVDRRNAFSLSTLSTHISKSLLDGRPFSLKYQLPDHDLDSLVSITTDEDLANMVDEYDRLLSSGSNTRLRFFLFTTPSRGGCGGNELHDPTSEGWFIDALKNCGVGSGGGGKGDVGGGEGGGGGGGGNLAETIALEKTSSFGSTGSSTSNSVSPAVRSGGGGEEVGGGGGGGGVRLHDVNVLPTVDSFGSDGSLPSPNFSPQNIMFQDASGFVDSKPVLVNHVESAESNSSDRSPCSDLLTSVPLPNYIITKPMDQHLHPTPLPQPQYYHPASQSHYVTQYYPNHVPVPSYTPVYQPYIQPQQHTQYQVNKPYPIYMTPYGQTQNPYDTSTQCAIPTVAAPPSVAQDPQVGSNPVLVASPMVYDGYKPAIPTPDYGAKVFRTPAVVTQPSSGPYSDHHLHQQVVGLSPVSLPSQPVVVSSGETTNCMSDYEDAMHAQIYKTQPPGPTLPAQLQTAANATTAMLSEAFTQLHVDNKH